MNGGLAQLVRRLTPVGQERHAGEPTLMMLDQGLDKLSAEAGGGNRTRDMQLGNMSSHRYISMN